MIALVKRNIKVYTRDRMAFFMSFLSVIILLVLYQVFLGELQVDGIKESMQMEDVSIQVQQMVNLWLISGLSTVVCMSGTLGVYSVMIKDKEDKITEDFRISMLSSWKLELSYVIAAVLLGFIISFVCCFVGLLIFNGFGVFEIFSFMDVVKIIGILFFGCLLSSTLVLPFLSIIKSTSAFSTLSTIIGTIIGFLSGVYISIGSVDEFLAQIMTWFPLTQINSLLKSVLMDYSMNEVFKNASSEVISKYKESYGVTLLGANGHVLSDLELLMYITICIACFLMLYLAIKQGSNVWKKSLNITSGK